MGRPRPYLSRPPKAREALLRNLFASLVKAELIRTTTSRAKALKQRAEKLISLATKGDLHSRRIAGRQIYEKRVLQKLFNILGPRYKSRTGGYVRVMRAGMRRGDGAETAIVELVDSTVIEDKKKKKEKKQKKKTPGRP